MKKLLFRDNDINKSAAVAIAFLAVLAKLAATPGYENQPAILFQAHMDMVCRKDEGVEFDFLDASELWLKPKAEDKRH